jgi:hypothetical protein
VVYALYQKHTREGIIAFSIHYRKLGRTEDESSRPREREDIQRTSYATVSIVCTLSGVDCIQVSTKIIPKLPTAIFMTKSFTTKGSMPLSMAR